MLFHNAYKQHAFTLSIIYTCIWTCLRAMHQREGVGVRTRGVRGVGRGVGICSLTYRLPRLSRLKHSGHPLPPVVRLLTRACHTFPHSGCLQRQVTFLPLPYDRSSGPYMGSLHSDSTPGIPCASKYSRADPLNLGGTYPEQCGQPAPLVVRLCTIALHSFTHFPHLHNTFFLLPHDKSSGVRPGSASSPAMYGCRLTSETINLKGMCVQEVQAVESQVLSNPGST